MITTHTKMSLIQARGVRCEICKCTRWKGCSILPGLVMARKDFMNPVYSDENAILLCRMCYYTEGYNKRRPFKRRTKAEIAVSKSEKQKLAGWCNAVAESFDKQGQQ